jgi:peptide/nickel transport system substrate-binding protein
MLRNRLMLVLGLLIIASMVLAACQPAAGGTEEATEEATAVATTRVGGWADELIFTANADTSSAVAQLQAGEVDMFVMSLSDPEVYATIKDDPNVSYSTSVGTYDAFQFNTIECADGRLNPFHYIEVREAMHWLVDREYLIQEYLGGLGLAKYTPFTVAFPDYARYIDVVRAMEAKYAYNPTKAEEQITAKMTELGSTKDANGKWLDPTTGEPIVIIALIRPEDERSLFGEYLSGQLESVGFTLDRQVKPRADARPIWGGDATLCEWFFYTAGWINNSIARDEASNFAFYYTANGGYAESEWLLREPDPTLDAVALRLLNSDYSSAAERDELIREVMPLGMQDNTIMLLVDTTSFQLYSSDIEVSHDLAANIEASAQWPYTLRWKGQEGGTIRILQSGFLVGPWNAVAGSNFVDDGMMQKATEDVGFLWDPYTGLVWPLMAESFDFTALDSLPIFQSDVSTDWASFTQVPEEIAVPADAWYDWDPATGNVITVGEAFPDGVTAKTLGVVTYPADLFDKVKWHDGTPLSPADFVMNFFMVMSQCKEDSPMYDPAAVPNCETWFGHFKGFRVTSVAPLTIETYDDFFQTDVELNPYSWWPAETGSYAYGGGSWSMLALGNIAEAAGEMAYSIDKATTANIEETSYISGPTLEVLATHLDACIADAASCIEYPAVFGNYITADQALTAFTNLKTFYTTYGHMWIGTGPYFISAVFPVEKSMTFLHNPDYPFLADRWSIFGVPKVATVDITGPAEVTIGDEAEFEIAVTFEGEAYPANELASVNWLLFNAAGELATKGPAVLVEDGTYTVTLPADVTGQLTEGANRLEIAVASKLVALPGLGALEFVTVP